jgi:molybdate transport system substrate-binding protein
MRIAFIQLCLLGMSVSFTPMPISFTPPPLTPPPQRTEVVVAAAADLKFAMDSLVATFSKNNPDITIKVVYGSSGNFFQQIGNGAPFDLFFSADIDYPRQLTAKHLTLSDAYLYGTGQLVLWSKSIDPAVDQMNTLLNSTIKKIAIANPAHAPYGRRAEEAIRHYDLYDQIKDKLVLGENIAQTAQYAQSGAADIGIIALSLALSPAMQQSGGKYWLIPADSHQPLEQSFVLLPHAKDNKGAYQFMNFITTPEARAVLKSFGFSQP